MISILCSLASLLYTHVREASEFDHIYYTKRGKMSITVLLEGGLLCICKKGLSKVIYVTVMY